MLAPLLIFALAVFAIAIQAVMSNRAAQAADAAAIACVYSGGTERGVLQSYLEYYQPQIDGIQGQYRMSSSSSDRCQLDVSYTLVDFLPSLRAGDNDLSVSASGGEKGVLIKNETSIPTELVLVLDISGSMSGQLLDLKSILKDAMNTISEAPKDTVRISIVPFESGVSAHRPAWLIGKANGVYCIDGLSRDASNNFSAQLTVDRLNATHQQYPVETILANTSFFECSQYAPLLPLTNDLNQVDRHISSLTTSGGTASYQGVIWGARQLLPQWQASWGVPINSDGNLKRKLVLFTDGDDSNNNFKQLISAGFCTKLAEQYGIEMDFIGFGVTDRLQDFNNCIQDQKRFLNNKKRAHSADNISELREFFLKVLAVEYQPEIKFAKQ